MQLQKRQETNANNASAIVNMGKLSKSFKCLVCLVEMGRVCIVGDGGSGGVIVCNYQWPLYRECHIRH